MADRARVKRKEVRALAQAHAADMPHRVTKRGVYVVEQRAGGANEVRFPLKAEAVERSHVEVAQKFLLCGVEGEGPGVGVGDVPWFVVCGLWFVVRAIVVRPGQHNLGGTQTRKRVVEAFLRLERLHRELARREIEHREAESGDGGDVGVRAFVEETVFRNRAGRHDARHLAADDLSLLHEARILHLVADGGGLARADEFREIGVKRMVRDAAQRRAGALRKRGTKNRRCNDGVLPEHLVEVAEAEHQDGTWWQLALDRAILTLHGCEFFGHEGGYYTTSGRRNRTRSPSIGLDGRGVQAESQWKMSGGVCVGTFSSGARRRCSKSTDMARARATHETAI